MKNNSPEILTRKEAAEFLRISLRTLDYFVMTKQVPFSRLGVRHVRFSRERLLEHMREREGMGYQRMDEREKANNGHGIIRM